MSNTTDKIQQTVENTRYVFASTDMTAIYSFVIAAVIGVFLAWWYGKKSFDLTTQSFKTTIKQIEASIDSAKDNTEKMVEGNRDLIFSQSQTQQLEFKFRVMQDWVIKFDNISAEFFENVLSFFDLINLQARQYAFATNTNEKKEVIKIALEDTNLAISKIVITKYKLHLLLDLELEMDKEVYRISNAIDSHVRGEYYNNCLKKQEHIDYKHEEQIVFNEMVTLCMRSMRTLRKQVISRQLDAMN